MKSNSISMKKFHFAPYPHLTGEAPDRQVLVAQEASIRSLFLPLVKENLVSGENCRALLPLNPMTASEGEEMEPSAPTTSESIRTC